MSKLFIGTRGSKLALAQSEQVAAALRALHPGLEVELRIITTTGDRVQGVALSAVGDKGLFVKEIEQALLAGEIDLAVHSCKDLPSLLPPGLTLAAFPQREDARDALVVRTNANGNMQNAAPNRDAAAFSLLHVALPRAARVGTSSLRRACQLRALRPDLQVLDVRGNVDTRLRKLGEGGYDAIVLAFAGLKRLGLVQEAGSLAVSNTPFSIQVLPPEVMLPAVAQGALAIEARADDASTLRLLAALDDPATRSAALAERAFLRRLEGGCQVPMAAYAEVSMAAPQCSIQLRGLVGAVDGSVVVRGERTGHTDDPEALGRALAEELIERGAGALLQDQ
jgi:hydroxymethylbilane synthase